MVTHIMRYTIFTLFTIWVLHAQRIIFKWLGIATRHFYISCAIVFDENVFCFATLHPNAYTHLRAETIYPPDITKILSSGSMRDVLYTNPTIFPNHVIQPLNT